MRTILFIRSLPALLKEFLFTHQVSGQLLQGSSKKQAPLLNQGDDRTGFFVTLRPFLIHVESKTLTMTRLAKKLNGQKSEL